MTKENSIEKVFSAFNLEGGEIDSLTNSSLSFRSRRLIAEGLYPKKNKSKKKHKPNSPRFTPLPDLEKR